MDLHHIYPVHFGYTERMFLLPLLERWLKELWESGPEGVRQHRIIYPVFEHLRDCKPEDKMLYEMRLEAARVADKLKTNPYVILKVSKRTYKIINVNGTTEYNPSYGGTDMSLPNQVVAARTAVPVTKNLSYREAEKVYAFLALGIDLPAYLKKHLITDEEDD